jgi:cell division protease FtsH
MTPGETMKSTFKTILIWLGILTVAVGLYNLAEHGKGARRILNFTEFLNHVENGQIADVVVSGSNLTGHLIAGKESFRTTIPKDYASLYDRLTSKNVSVTVLPPQTTASWEVPPILLFVGLMLWLAISAVILILVVDLSRFVKRELARTAGARSSI